MSKRDKELFLFDVFIAIVKIKEYSKDFKNGLDLKYDCKSWDAVIREFEIIGEATNYLIKSGHFGNDKREIVDFRNILIHEYFGIDEEEIWDIINNFLDIYKSEIIKDISNIDTFVKKDFIEKLIEENRYIKFVVAELERVI
jgi:uncharacterized protein with HEPN domain